MAENHVLLETIELTQVASSITFDNLPSSGYTDLKILMSARGNGTGFGTSPWENCSLTLNGTTNTSAKQLFATASGTGSDSQVNGTWLSDSDATSNTYSNNEIYLPNYRSSTAKTVSVDNVTENNATDTARVLWNALYSTVTTAVTSITIATVSGSILAGSTFSLYGIAATGTTPAIAPKATGGNIVANDGTYWYHAFLTSGNFIPQQNLTCHYLVVAGGGSGGVRYGGGGGAGGLRSTVGATGGGGSLESPISVTANTAYPIQVGAGGSSASGLGSIGINGSNSVFSTITSIGGGGGGAISSSPNYNGNPGGSGGGGAYAGSGGAPTTNQGYAGGTGVASNKYPTAGGGGAGGVGQSPASSTSNAGAGGTGVLITALATPTTTGVSGYYGGGGGGGGSTDGGVAAPGAGGAGGGGTGGVASGAVGVSGIRGTGGGGGGGWGDSTTASGAGGSGIVIIRYPMAS